MLIEQCIMLFYINNVGLYRSLDRIDLPHLDKNQMNEVLHHAHFCNKKIKNFCGRDELLANIKARFLVVKTKEDAILHEVERKYL